MQAFSVIEQPSFVQLITGLQPQRSLMTRKTFMSRMEAEYQNMQLKLQNEFATIQFLCTTADLWSNHNKSFLGVTAHWIDEDTLTRKSAALACCRLKGRHTYDVLAEALDGIHSKFGIRQKVSLTVTDNGSNFVKAFEQFSKQSGADNEQQTQTYLEQQADGEVIFTEVNPLLSDNSSSTNGFLLPPHQRCASHTLNLVAVHDSQVAESDAMYKKISRSAMAKCTALWNKASRSTQAAEVIHDKTKFSLIVPNTTRWNSTFDAVDRICDIVRKKSDTILNEICKALSLPVFAPNEIAFLKEYCEVMKPLTVALDVLQAQEKCFLGFLLPTIVSLRKRLIGLKQSVKMALPLIEALLIGIANRFDKYFCEDNIILASVTHPLFKFRWMADQQQKEQIRVTLLAAMNAEASRQAQSSTELELAVQDQDNACNSNNQEDIQSFFSFDDQPQTDMSVVTELDLYLVDKTTCLSSLDKYPVIKRLFLCHNTGLPSSAAVERMFSLAGQILLPRRNRMNDDNFEMQLLLRANKSININTHLS